MRMILAIALSGFGMAVVSAPDSAPGPRPCTLTIQVPVGATLTVNGVRTEQMTAVRYFESPPLPAGKTFYYTFEATYTKNGEAVQKRKPVEVKAGATVVVDLTQAETVSQPKPKPKKAAFEPNRNQPQAVDAEAPVDPYQSSTPRR
jgi:uncharacterized protein (TIGR03000 family)